MRRSRARSYGGPRGPSAAGRAREAAERRRRGGAATRRGGDETKSDFVELVTKKRMTLMVGAGARVGARVGETRVQIGAAASRGRRVAGGGGWSIRHLRVLVFSAAGPIAITVVVLDTTKKYLKPQIKNSRQYIYIQAQP